MIRLVRALLGWLDRAERQALREWGRLAGMSNEELDEELRMSQEQAEAQVQVSVGRVREVLEQAIAIEPERLASLTAEDVVNDVCARLVDGDGAVGLSRDQLVGQAHADEEPS